MISSVFANAKNTLTITLGLSTTLFCAYAADEEKETSPLSVKTLLQSDKLIVVNDGILLKSPISPRHRYQLIPSQESLSYQWAVKNQASKKFRLSSSFLSLPSHVDFSAEIPFIREQGNLGACTAICMVTFLEYYEAKLKKEIKFSPLFIYYNGRKLADTIEEDRGASLTDVIQSVYQYGACKEISWPYDEEKFMEKPSEHAYKEPHSIFKGLRFSHSKLSNDIETIKESLSQGTPVLCGINIFPSFEYEETKKTGIIPMPESSEAPMGGHAITFVGYNDDTGYFKFANSWGDNWGANGYGYLPYNYITNLNINNNSIHTYPDEIWSFKLMNR